LTDVRPTTTAPSFHVFRRVGELYAAVLRSEWRIALEH
jgi:hypothetical protein